MNGCIKAPRKPIVSVVIPTFRRAELLGNALESVYGQKGSGRDFQLQVIVVDNAGCDATREVVERYPDAQFLRQLYPKGPAAARNAGIRASTGSYVAFLDDDDTWFPDKLHRQLPVLQDRDDILVVYGQGLVYREDSKESPWAWPEDCWGLSGRVFERFLVQDTPDVFNMDTIILPRAAFDVAGYFDETLPTMEHHELCLRLAFHFPFLFIPGPVVRGRFSNKGLWFNSLETGSFAQTYPIIIEKALAMLPQPDPQLSRQARAVAWAIVAEQLWWHGGPMKVQQHLLAGLRTWPWMLQEPAFRRHVTRLLGESIKEGGAQGLAACWREFRDAMASTGLEGSVSRRRLLADLLGDTAVGLAQQGSARAAGYTAALAMLRALAEVRRPELWRCLGVALRSVACPRRRRPSQRSQTS
jgi:hypothetical protein